ncbi:hypothetical protein [Azospirillum sp. Marseille-Q6669]
MSNFLSSKRAKSTTKLAALGAVQAIIELSPDGMVLSANDNFLTALECSPDEIKSRHWSSLLSFQDGESSNPQGLWDAPRRGESKPGECLLFGKTGRGS